MKIFNCLAILSTTLLADPVPEMPTDFPADPTQVIRAAEQATVRRFPDADSVLVDDRIHTRFEADGSDVTWDDEWVKVLTEKGRRSHATVTLDYNERYGDAGVLCLEVVGTNGVTRTIDFARTLKVATDNSGMGANIVDPADKKVSCSIPDLQVGEIRHVRFWRRTRKARMRNAWADANLLEQTQPIFSTVVTVDQPAELPVVHAVVRNPFTNTVTRAEDCSLPRGRRLLKWMTKDVPQAFPEPRMPPFSRCAQTLRLSTVKDWPTVSRWYWSLCEPHLAKTTPGMTNTVAALVGGCSDEAAKIRTLFKFVSQEVRYMGLTLEDDAPGYEPHDVDITFDNRYGVCRDKAALLVSLLRLAGIRAYPVLIHAGAKMDPEVPSPFFNHAIVAVEVPSSKFKVPGSKFQASGEEPSQSLNPEPGTLNLKPGTSYLLMDPTDESTKDLLPAYLSDKSYLVARPEGETLLTSPVASAEANLLRVSSEGSLDANGDALLTTSFAFNGINDTAVRHSLLKKTPEQRRKWFEGVWRGVASGAELLSVEILPSDLRNTEERLTAKTVVRLPEVLLRGRTRDALSLPFATMSLSVVNGILDENTALEKRRFPLVLPCTAATEESLRLTLNDSVGPILSLPVPTILTTPSSSHAPFSFTRTVACTNGVLTARRVMRVEDVNFDVATYDALRNARKEVETAEREGPYFKVRTDEDANVHIREESTVMHFTSPNAWTTTNIVEKEILTYRGKQTSSELNFTYAPSTRSIELVSATVSNRNGKVLSVTPKEINVMDCSWAASAPRYPASKILVVNLPGVEIGSVVRYVVARSVTNAPVAEAFSYPFGGRNPVDYEKVEMHIPEGLDFREKTSRLLAKSLKVTTNAHERVYSWTMRNPLREPDEASQPPSSQWRPCFSVSLADWNDYGSSLVGALAAARGEGSVWVPWSGDSSRTATARAKAKELVADCTAPADRIRALRRFLRKIRVTGPGLFELPFDQAFTAPDRVLSEGYGSRTDYMNLFRVMLEAAGFDCAFALVAGDALGFQGTEEKWRAMPRPGTFGTLVIHAVWRSAGIPFLREKFEFWLSTENDYTPPEASSNFGNAYFDPQTISFGRIAASSPEWVTRDDNFCRMDVRENGAVDFTVRNCTYGSGVGGLRKRFAELLPEMRSRFHQKLLGSLAQNATATSELETDVEGYPFTLSLKAYAEGYAVAKDDCIRLTIDDFTGKVFGVGGERRRSPIGLNGKREVVDTYEIVFPEGYTTIDALPKSFTIHNPRDDKDVWLKHEVSSRIVDRCLHVTVRRCVSRAKATYLGPDLHPFLHDWNRRAAAESARAVSVRKSK